MKMSIIKTYAVLCPVCNEDISDRTLDGASRAEAEQTARDHRELHKQEGTWPDGRATGASLRRRRRTYKVPTGPPAPDPDKLAAWINDRADTSR